MHLFEIFTSLFDIKISKELFCLILRCTWKIDPKLRRKKTDALSVYSLCI